MISPKVVFHQLRQFRDRAVAVVLFEQHVQQHVSLGGEILGLGILEFVARNRC